MSCMKSQDGGDMEWLNESGVCELVQSCRESTSEAMYLFHSQTYSADHGCIIGQFTTSLKTILPGRNQVKKSNYDSYSMVILLYTSTRSLSCHGLGGERRIAELW